MWNNKKQEQKETGAIQRKRGWNSCRSKASGTKNKLPKMALDGNPNHCSFPERSLRIAICQHEYVISTMGNNGKRPDSGWEAELPVMQINARDNKRNLCELRIVLHQLLQRGRKRLMQED